MSNQRTLWNEAVASAEIVATPVKVQRTNQITGRTQTFWELVLEINGQHVAAECSFRFVYKTRKAASEGAASDVKFVRSFLATQDLYFESIDFPDTDYVKAVLS